MAAMSSLEVRPEDEMMVVRAARMLAHETVCFVGVGLPSAAALVARLTCAPHLYLVYESGILGPHLTAMPLSVADDQLAKTAQTIVSVAEVFNYWLQPGRIDVGVLGTAQVDRFGNLNTTVIGKYDNPGVRLPGAGGAPEIAAACRSVVVMVRQSPRSLVEQVDFVTSLGHGRGRGERMEAGLPGGGPRAVVTDLGVYEPDGKGGGLRLTELQPGVSVSDARVATGWDLVVAPDLRVNEPPDDEERDALRRLRDQRLVV